MSNIAWDPADDDAVAEVLVGAGVDAVEIAPPKAFGDPRSASLEDAERYRVRWQERGLPVVATQSLLFGRPELQLFGEQASREALLEHLAHVLALGGALGARAQVFGSPRNRVTGGRDAAAVGAVAADAFGRLAEVAEQHGTALCLEANPAVYGTDFLTSAHEAAALVRAVGRPGLRLHLDVACMQLAGDDISDCVRRHADLLIHCHLSEPELGPVGARPNPGHAELVRALQEVGYTGAVSVEMRQTESPVADVRRAAAYARNLVPA